MNHCEPSRRFCFCLYSFVGWFWVDRELLVSISIKRQMQEFSLSLSLLKALAEEFTLLIHPSSLTRFVPERLCGKQREFHNLRITFAVIQLQLSLLLYMLSPPADIMFPYIPPADLAVRFTHNGVEVGGKDELCTNRKIKQLRLIPFPSYYG